MEAYVFLGADLDAEEAVSEGVDDDVGLVELRDDGVGGVVLGVLGPHNVHQVIADVALLLNQRLFVDRVGHSHRFVERELQDGGGVVEEVLTDLVALELTAVTLVSFDLHLEIES